VTDSAVLPRSKMVTDKSKDLFPAKEQEISCFGNGDDPSLGRM